MWQCTCGHCVTQESEARLRQHSHGAEQADAAMASLLRDEEVLAGAVFELYASVDVEKPRCLAQPQQAQLTGLLCRCEDRLGPAHWSTQALRRLDLMQSYETEGRGTARDKWVADMESCQAYIDETLAQYGI